MSANSEEAFVCHVATTAVGIGSSVYGLLQAVEFSPAAELAQAAPSVAESVPRPCMPASEHSCPAHTEGTDQTSPGHTALLHASQQDVQHHSVGSVVNMLPVTVPVHDNTAEPPKAVAFISDDAAMTVVPGTEAAAAAQTSEAAATTDSSEATAIITAAKAVTAASAVTMAASTTAATTAAAPPATMTAAATAASTAEVMALPVAHAVAEAAAGGMYVLLAGHSLSNEGHPPSCADSFKVNNSASTAAVAVAAASNPRPAALPTDPLDAVVTDTAAAVTAALAQPAIDNLSEESPLVDSVAVDPADASQLGSFPRETSAYITASSAIPAQLDGTAVESVNSVLMVCGAQAEGVDSASKACSAAAEGVGSVPTVCSTQAERIDSVPKVCRAQGKGLESAPETHSVEAEALDSRTGASGDAICMSQLMLI